MRILFLFAFLLIPCAVTLHADEQEYNRDNGAYNNMVRKAFKGFEEISSTQK